MKRTDWDGRLAAKLRVDSQAVPTDIHKDIEQVLAGLPERTKMPRRGRTPLRRSWIAAVTVIAVLVSAMLLFNDTNSFAAALKARLHSIFVESGDPALMSVNESNEMGNLAERTDHGYTIRIHEAMFDGQRLSVSYSVSHPGGIPKSLWVRPAFQLDESIKQAFPGLISTDSGGIRDDTKIGIVNYYFVGAAPPPDELTLKVDVKGIALFDDPAKQQILPGDWSFQIPVVKQGRKLQDIASLPTVADKNVSFEVKQVRLGTKSTLWRLNWIYPSKLQPDPLVKGNPRYTMRYVITASGHELTSVMEVTNSGRYKKDGQLVDGMNYEGVTLVTEQLPDEANEVTITPILRKWDSMPASSGFIEIPLKSFAVKVPDWNIT
ncbi:DUF4179 domain-containing protein [Paenibacillus sp. MWE-103]|uniref:DUF4179 domain-containing protein n=1 Tax=Paenibacillus artemisiicola TaxID=1172618 RepID=A0ABS3WLE9_9BACL|nr:DUF4179 domain-containing protein [Paenibacillus artemisiicola]MBO7748960.1 DUF4179 domain-containing protein [Paenibacillus artemisiicola]